MGLGVVQEVEPDGFAFTDHDRVGMPRSFIGNGRDVQASHDEGYTERPVAVGQFVSFADLGAQARNRDEVKLHGKDGELMQILDLMVLTAVGSGGHSCEGEQTQARQRGDDAPALDEPRQREPQLQELRVDCSDAAHCNQADSHRRSPSRRKSPVATIRLVTGMKKRWRSG